MSHPAALGLLAALSALNAFFYFSQGWMLNLAALGFALIAAAYILAV